MKLELFSHEDHTFTARHATKKCLTALLVLTLGLNWDLAVCRAQQPGDEPGTEVLTRGPVHEAFAELVTYNPEPGVVVTKGPPELIEEMPPEERPQGDNVTWIPGYWAWDDERNDFLWVSGTWRALPPGRQWMAGYWSKTTQGYQWISGYWADASVRETAYLPPPPETIEAGPNVAAPSVDYSWAPGCWIWYSGRYAWRPGYWMRCREDWNWAPDHYVWTPRGHIFVRGFWDYPVARRGVLFAPVYFQSGIYARHGYRYGPSIAIDLGVFTDNLFLRPRYQHYYFGDYYAASYTQIGFFTSVSFQSRHYGYDPVFTYQRWEHRDDREWEHRVVASYDYRRDHEAARPPRTWAAAQRNPGPGPGPGPAEARSIHVMAAPIAQMARRTDGPVRFQPVANEERQRLAQRGQEVQKSRDERRTVEARPAEIKTRPGAKFEPAKVTLAPSPIVARPVKQLEKSQAPPEVQRAPKPDLKQQPKAERPGNPRDAERNNPPSQPRQPIPERRDTPERRETPPRETTATPTPAPGRTRPAESPAAINREPTPTPRPVTPAPTPTPAPAPRPVPAEPTRILPTPTPTPARPVERPIERPVERPATITREPAPTPKPTVVSPAAPTPTPRPSQPEPARVQPNPTPTPSRPEVRTVRPASNHGADQMRERQNQNRSQPPAGAPPADRGKRPEEKKPDESPGKP